MPERPRLFDENMTCSSTKLLFIILLKLELVISTGLVTSPSNTSNHSCYTCLEQLIGYTDHSESCRYLNTSSPTALAFIKDCSGNSTGGQYECRKVVISFRSVDTYLRRDCVPKKLCSWKDKARSASSIPVSDCVYTDERTQKLECIYCCDTPLCNRTISSRVTMQLLLSLLLMRVTEILAE